MNRTLVSLEVALGIRSRHGGFAQHIERMSIVSLLARHATLQRLINIPPHDKLLGH